MSKWTKIVSTIHADTYIKLPDIESYARVGLENAPLITGSERNADVFVNAKSGTNHFDGERDWQTQVVITICGSLRDRGAERVEKEFNNFLEYIEKVCGWDILHMSYNVEEA